MYDLTNISYKLALAWNRNGNISIFSNYVEMNTNGTRNFMFKNDLTGMQAWTNYLDHNNIGCTVEYTYETRTSGFTSSVGTTSSYKTTTMNANVTLDD